MEESLSGLLPEGLAALDALILIVAALFASFITAAFGLGGGVALLAVMAMILPPAVLIPVHGVVQAGSNIGRFAVMVRHVAWSVVGPFALGSLLGAALGGLLAVDLPPWLLQLGLAIFILYACWGPPPPAFGQGTILLGGAFSTFLTMFFGATGPFVSAAVKTLGLGRMEHVGTFSACMSVQHGLKIIAFGVLGFAFGAYVPLMAFMVASGFVGTLLGRRLLLSLDDRKFSLALNLVLTLLALRLIWAAMSTLLA